MRPVLDSQCFLGGGVRLLTSGYFFRASSGSAGVDGSAGAWTTFSHLLGSVRVTWCWYRLARTRGFGWVVPRSWAGLGLST